jgi:predicted HTH domain antitoxin
MSVTISDSVLQAARMSEQELRQEIAVMLFEQEKLTLAQASRLAEMNQVSFRYLLASREISLHYGVAELEEDVAENSIHSPKTPVKS